MLFLYLLTQTVNQEYDTFDSCVVVSKDAYQARYIQPRWRGEVDVQWEGNNLYDWADPKYVKASLVGVAGPNLSEGDVICASFNAG